MATEVGIKLNLDFEGDDTLGNLEKNAKKAGKSLGELEDFAEGLREKLKGVEVGSEAFNKITRNLAQTEGQIKDIELAFESLDFEGRLTAFGDVTSGVAGGFAAITGAQALLGAESEELEKTLLKVNSAIAIAVGVRDIGTAISGFSKLTKASKSFGAVQKVLNIILNANPIVLIVAGFIALGAAMDQASKGIKDFIRKALGPVSAALDVITSLVHDIGVGLGLLSSDAEKAAARAAKNAIKATRRIEEEERKRFMARQDRLDRQAKAEENALDFEVKMLAAAGKETFEKEQEKLEAVLERIKRQKKALREQLAFELEVLEAANQAALKSTSVFEQAEAAKRFNAAEEQRKRIEDTLDSLEAEGEAAEQQILINDTKQEKKRQDAAKRAAENRKREDEAAAKAREEEEKKRAEEEAARIQRIIDSQNLEEQLRTELLAEGAEKDKLKRQQEFDAKIADLEEKGILTNEAEKLLAQQLVNDLAEIDRVAKEEQAARDKEAQDKKDAEDEEAKQKELEREQSIAAAKLSIQQSVIQGLGELNNILVRDQVANEKVQKSLALVQIGLDTAQAISALTKNSEANPANAVTGGIAGAAQFATGLVRILTNIGKAVQILRSTGTTAAPSTSSLGGGGGAIPQNANPATSGSTLIGGANNQQRPTKVFVTETDISNVQNRVGVIEAQATID